MSSDEPEWLARASEPTLQIYRYWRSKCVDGRLPKRSDIDPSEIPRLLPQLSIVEVVADDRRYIYRLIGTREAEVRGSDPTGKSVKDGFFGPSIDNVLACYDKVAASGEALYDDSKYTTPDGRFSDDETLFLPLAADGHKVNQILVFGTYSELSRN